MEYIPHQWIPFPQMDMGLQAVVYSRKRRSLAIGYACTFHQK
ncbi:hypothetical protein Javan527_0018 [Streptococcus phage Javan527]|nr:hypothetical protein Javan527_0018 [Streptococcus phage Javan527]